MAGEGEGPLDPRPLGAGTLIFGDDVALTDITHFVLHPGGAKVMATYRSALGLDEDQLHIARETMRRYGNQSSASVLFMLSDLVASGRPCQEDVGLMMALGPGFAAEMLTLSW